MRRRIRIPIRYKITWRKPKVTWTITCGCGRKYTVRAGQTIHCVCGSVYRC